jgi:hypothetical protein
MSEDFFARSRAMSASICSAFSASCLARLLSSSLGTFRQSCELGPGDEQV